MLEALRTSPYRHIRPLQFNALFGYILGNRDGIAARSVAVLPRCALAAESLKRISKCESAAVSNVRAGAGVATAPSTLPNCSGSKLIPPIGPIGGAKPL